MRLSRSRGQRIIFGIMSLIMVLSMVLGLALTMMPEPKRPTPTPTIRRITPLPTPPPRSTPTPQPTLTPIATPTPTPTATPASSSLFQVVATVAAGGRESLCIWDLLEYYSLSSACRIARTSARIALKTPAGSASTSAAVGAIPPRSRSFFRTWVQGR